MLTVTANEKNRCSYRESRRKEKNASLTVASRLMG